MRCRLNVHDALSQAIGHDFDVEALGSLVIAHVLGESFDIEDFDITTIAGHEAVRSSGNGPNTVGAVRITATKHEAVADFDVVIAREPDVAGSTVAQVLEDDRGVGIFEFGDFFAIQKDFAVLDFNRGSDFFVRAFLGRDPVNGCKQQTKKDEDGREWYQAFHDAGCFDTVFSTRVICGVESGSSIRVSLPAVQVQQVIQPALNDVFLE